MYILYYIECHVYCILCTVQTVLPKRYVPLGSWTTPRQIYLVNKTYFLHGWLNAIYIFCNLKTRGNKCHRTCPWSHLTWCAPNPPPWSVGRGRVPSPAAAPSAPGRWPGRASGACPPSPPAPWSQPGALQGYTQYSLTCFRLSYTAVSGPDLP